MFTDYYGEQSCTAGRSTFITGQTVLRTGLSKVGLPGADLGLKAEDVTIAELLKPMGYMTGQFDKNHLGDKDEHLPTAHGFDEFFGNLYHLNAEEEPENVDYPQDPEFRQKFGPRGVIKSTADGKIEDTGPLTRKRVETVDEETLDAALDFMDRAVKADKPFFVWWNATRMHFRTHVKEESAGKTGISFYADGMVEHDNHVGELLKKVDDLGIKDNTIVFYSTDNGPHMNSWPDAGLTPFRGEKNTNWEGAYRVPAMVRWPGKIKPGSVSNEIMHQMDWMPTFLAAWFPDSPYRNQQHFAVAFYADEIGHQGSADALAYSAQDASLAPIIRASALERMAGNQSQNTLISLARAVKHDNEMIRLGAIEGASGYEFADQWKILAPLLTDPVLAVRTETAAALVSGYLSMSAAQKAQLKPALDEYIEIQRFNADRGFGRVNLGNVHRQMGDSAQAERLYQQAIQLEPYFENSYINLADLYRTQGDESKAREVLLSGLTAQPNSSIIPYSLGLSLLRSGDRAKANEYLAIAAKGAQTNAQYWYVYGLALEGSDVMAASQALNQAYQVGGNPQHLYAQCEVLARNRHSAEVDEALRTCLGTLAQVVPAEVVGQLRARLGLAPQ